LGIFGPLNVEFTRIRAALRRSGPTTAREPREWITRDDQCIWSARRRITVPMPAGIISVHREYPKTGVTLENRPPEALRIASMLAVRLISPAVNGQQRVLVIHLEHRASSAPECPIAHLEYFNSAARPRPACAACRSWWRPAVISRTETCRQGLMQTQGNTALSRLTIPCPAAILAPVAPPRRARGNRLTM